MGESTKNVPGPRIIGIVTAANRRDPSIWKMLESCDLVEIRADGWDAARIPAEVQSFRDDCARQMGRSLESILTIRLKRDGGAWPDELRHTREKVWLSLGLDKKDAPIQWIDLETEEFDGLSWDMRNALASGSVKVLMSHHNFTKGYPLPGYRRLSIAMKAHSPQGMKIATTCRTSEELVELLRFARELAATTPNGCAISMGSVGRSSRVLAPLLGCPFTYGYLTGGAVAPGQLSVQQLREFYDAVTPEGLKAKSDPELVDWAEARLPRERLAQ